MDIFDSWVLFCVSLLRERIIKGIDYGGKEHCEKRENNKRKKSHCASGLLELIHTQSITKSITKNRVYWLLFPIIGYFMEIFIRKEITYNQLLRVVIDYVVRGLGVP